MTLNFSGTGPTVVRAPGATIQPFKALGLQDSLQGPATVGVENLFITVSDINGGPPTDADGTFALSPPLLHQVAPGTYILTPGPRYDAAAKAASDLQGLSFAAAQTPSTALITVTAANATGQSAVDRLTQVVAAVPPAKFVVADTLANNNYAASGTPCAGPAGVSSQYVVQTDNPALSATNLNIAALAPGVFIHTGSGADAIDVSGVGGKNILDGGTNSNFLTGTAAGSGTDTFFVDAPAQIASRFRCQRRRHLGHRQQLPRRRRRDRVRHHPHL